MSSIDDLLSGGSRGAFNKDSVVGEQVTGPIVSAIERQVTDFVTKAPETWDNGDPKMQIVITVKTNERIDENDDGARSIYVKTWGLDKQALMQAIRDAGFTKASEALAAGNVFTATFVSTQPSKFGSDQKVYEYSLARGAHVPSLQQQSATSAPAVPQYQPPAPAPTAPQSPAPAPQYQQQAAPAAPVAPLPPAPVAPAPVTPSTALEAISLGWSDQQISAAFGIDPGIIPVLRSQIPPAA